MGTRLVLRLCGDNAQWGNVYVSDVVRLLNGVDRVVGRTASQLAGRAPGKAGPLPRSIAEATELRLSSVSEGSLVVEVEVPDAPADEPQLELADAPLGESAVRTALAVLAGSEAKFPETTAAWSRLAEELSIGERYDELACALPSDPTAAAVLDAPARTRLAAAAQQRSTGDRSGDLTGVLYEANFERCTGHLRTAIGDAVRVRFDDEQAAEIKEALRENSRLGGQISCTDETAALVSVESIEVIQPQRLALGPEISDFWTTRSLAELAEEQGVDVVHDVAALQDESISDEEAAAFIRALGL
ncbi:MAG: hypothetical protein OXG69_06280 [bacterium]|nr:hypothetical protein [bacterium]